MGIGEVGAARGGPGIILDRDGTLIDVVRDEETGTIHTAFHPNQVVLLPGVVRGLSALAAAGYVFGMATNQPGPAKGHFSSGAVERTNGAVVALLAEHGITISAVESCMHHPEGGPGGDVRLVGPCSCRKPQPGMVRTLVASLGLDPARSWMIGDSKADVQAGRAAGLRTGLVFRADRCELCPLRGGPIERPDAYAPDLDALASEVLRASTS